MYVAVIDSRYRVIGLGESEDEAIAAACKEYRRAVRRGTCASATSTSDNA